MPAAGTSGDQIGAPCTRTLRPLMSASERHRLVDEDVADAAAGIADQHHVGLLGDLLGDGASRSASSTLFQ